MRTALPLALLVAGCSTEPDAVPAGEAYAVALERCVAGDDAGALDALAVALAADPDAVQRALLEPAFDDGLRDAPEFRRALADAAVEHRVHRLELVGPDEPGERIEVECRVVDAAGEPLPGARAYVFATDADGRYHPTIEGEGTPRIFGVLVADERGRFAFGTVRPGPYPGTRNPRHVHVDVRSGDLRLAVPGYAVFDDDPLLALPENAEPRGEAVRIEMGGEDEDGVARGALVLPLR